MILAKGTILNGRYEILEKLGSGGMAIAYCGHDKMLDRYVTIKVLREEFSSDEDFKEKFKIEARSAASLSHPNIVNVYDVGEYNGISYIVMEYVHGDTLKKAIKEKAPFDTKTITNISLQMASALSAAHKNNVVHRDIKPQNILIGSDGVIKVTDFGIARAATGATVETAANAVGSVHYFSPEQARGGYVDEKSDIYSLGITMYEMATGRVPFDGENAVTIALKHLEDDLPDMRQFNPNLSKNIESIIKKATMKHSSDRYANIDLMIEDILKVKITEDNDDNNTYIEKQNENDDKEDIQLVPAGRRRSRMERKNETLDKHIGKIKISKDTDDFEPEYVEGDDMRRSNIKDRNTKRNLNTKKSPVKSNTKSRKAREEEYDDYDKGQEKKVIIAAVITALVIIVGISFAGFKFLGGALLGSNEKVTVPYFIGMELEEAEKEAKKLGISLNEMGEDYSNYDAGVIYAQNIEKGTSVKKGSEVGIKVSLGMAEYKMPDVTGKEEKDAIEAISDEVGKEPDIVYEFDNEVEIGKVISQSPSKGTTVTGNSDIKIVVSKGEEFKKVSVPNLSGKTEAEAKKLLESQGLILGTVTKTESKKVAEGKVITQTIAAGDEVAKNSVVDIVISTGAPEKEEPEKEDNKNNSNNENNTNSGTTNNENNTNNNKNNNINNNTNNNTNNSNTETENPPAESESTSTKNFPVYLKDGTQYGDTVHVKVVKTGSDGSVTVVQDSTQSTSSFPQQISVTGSGSATIECYIDGNLLWSENVNF